MSTMTITPAATTSTHQGTCPAWCDSGLHDTADSPHFGGNFSIDLSLAEPVEVPVDGVAPMSDWLTAALWQYAAADSPIVDLSIHDEVLSDMTLAEAEKLGNALLDLVRTARAAA
jgi:hypothetical protein